MGCNEQQMYVGPSSLNRITYVRFIYIYIPEVLAELSTVCKKQY